MVMKVKPGPAEGFRLKANTAGMIIKPPRIEAAVVRNVIQAQPLKRLVSRDRYEPYVSMQPHPMQIEKNVKPMADKRLSKLKASGFQAKR